MADDLKITEMAELLSGGLHDDLLFEVVDLTEPAVEDQNKKVKMVTLEAAFGAEDKIFEGDSSIEVIDLGTGQIDTTIDAQLLSRYTLAQLYFQVDGADNGVNPYIDLDGAANALKLGYQGDLHLNIGIGSSASIRAVSGTDEWFYVHPDGQRLGNAAAGQSSVRVTTAGDITAYTAGNQALLLDNLGNHVFGNPAGYPRIQFGATNNEIWCYGDADNYTLISKDSEIFLARVNGVNAFRIDSPGTYVDAGFGVNNSVRANVNAYGHTTGQALGGAFYAWVSDDYNGSITNYSFRANEDDLVIDAQATNILKYDGGLGDWLFSPGGILEVTINGSGLALKTGAAVNEIETVLTNDDTHLPTSGAVFDAIAAIETDKISEGDSYVEVVDTGTGYIVMVVDGVEVARWTAASAEMHLGVNDTRQGILHIYGSNISTEGGKLRLYYGGSGGTGAPEYGDIYFSATNGIEIGLPGAICAAFGAQSDAKLYYQNNPRFRTNNIGAQVERGSALMYFYNTGSDLHWKLKNQGNGGQIIMAGKQPGGAEVDIATFDYNGLDLASGMGLSFNGGQAINTIETVLTNDDTHLPTSGAVYDAIAAAVPDQIIEGDSKVEVIDAGTGQVDVTVDSQLVAHFQSNLVYTTKPVEFRHFSAKIGEQGAGDAAAGLFIYGGGSGPPSGSAGGALVLYVNEDYDTIVDRYFVNIGQDDLSIGSDTEQDVIKLVGGASMLLQLQAAGGVEIGYGLSNVQLKSRNDGLEFKNDQTGAAAIGNAATSVSVTFGTAKADANYQVLCTMENTTDGSPLFLIPVVTAKATTGFTVTLSAATDSANYVLNWMVLRS